MAMLYLLLVYVVVGCIWYLILAVIEYSVRQEFDAVEIERRDRMSQIGYYHDQEDLWDKEQSITGDKVRIEGLKNKAKWIRQQVLEMCVKAGAGHIAPALSCVEILLSVYEQLNITPDNRYDPDRDRFVLSKGQGCAALYAVLAQAGFFPVEDLTTYTQDGSYLGGHSESNVPGVEAFTGSLGNGFGIAVGMALAGKMRHKSYHVFCLLGDGELNEGAVWEGAMFAAHHKLGNITAIVDRNWQQAVDFTEDALKLEPLAQKWKSFEWKALDVRDGHNFEEILPALEISRAGSDKPHVIIVNTIKGKGISYMERQPIWHYRVPETAHLVDQARKELGL